VNVQKETTVPEPSEISPDPRPPVTLAHIARTWWPLAASWMLMSAEGPAHSAVVARLPNPEVNLAAWGGIVFPVALMMGAPITMLLAASTALSKDWRAYRLLRRFTLILGGGLTLLHAIIALTPLYDVVVRVLIDAPPATHAPGRWGFVLMTPWAGAIAYRRLQQGVMIRFGYTRAVGLGTVIRLTANVLVLAVGYLVGTLPGIVVAGGAVATGILTEAVYAGLRVRPILRDHVCTAPPADPPLTLRALLRFYAPLMLTTLMAQLMQSIGSAAMSRMPRALDSLAVWSVLTGVFFFLRSPGIAYNEVVVALLDRPGSLRPLRRFTHWLIGGVTLLTVLINVTPLARLWLARAMALPPDLVRLGRRALWLALLLPAQSVMLSWYQGAILQHRATRGIPESVALYQLALGAVLGLGMLWQRAPGLFVTLVAMEVAGAVQVAWLWSRSRPAMQAVATRDGHALRLPAAKKIV
jgi:hypothetical protein